jgi:hypothetical protein
LDLAPHPVLAGPLPFEASDELTRNCDEVTEQRLYQLIRQSGPISERQFEIEFLDSGVQAFAVTFG